MAAIGKHIPYSQIDQLHRVRKKEYAISWHEKYVSKDAANALQTLRIALKAKKRLFEKIDAVYHACETETTVLTYAGVEALYKKAADTIAKKYFAKVERYYPDVSVVVKKEYCQLHLKWSSETAYRAFKNKFSIED